MDYTNSVKLIKINYILQFEKLKNESLVQITITQRFIK